MLIAHLTWLRSYTYIVAILVHSIGVALVIADLCLVIKRGGRSGPYRRPAPPD